MKTKITLAIGVIFIAGLVFIVMNNKPAYVPADTVLNAATSTQKTSILKNSASTTPYTMTHVAAHSTALSCWSAVNGGVYDLTSWIGNHPGGEQAILSICGKDGSSAFNTQHDGQKRPANELAGFKIGTLVK